MTTDQRLESFLRTGVPGPEETWKNGQVAKTAGLAVECEPPPGHPGEATVAGEIVTDAVLAPAPILLTKVKEPRPEEKTPIGGFNVVDPRTRGGAR
jgi:hypothetical protein